MNKLIATVLLGLSSFSANAIQLTEDQYAPFCKVAAYQAETAYVSRAFGIDENTQIRGSVEEIASMDLSENTKYMLLSAYATGITVAYYEKMITDFTYLNQTAKGISKKTFSFCLATVVNENGKV